MAPAGMPAARPPEPHQQGVPIPGRIVLLQTPGGLLVGYVGAGVVAHHQPGRQVFVCKHAPPLALPPLQADWRVGAAAAAAEAHPTAAEACTGRAALSELQLCWLCDGMGWE